MITKEQNKKYIARLEREIKQAIIRIKDLQDEIKGHENFIEYAIKEINKAKEFDDEGEE